MKKENFTPVGDKVLIEPTAAPKYSGLIHVLEDTQQSNRGKVVGIGPKCMQVKVDDTVIFRAIASIKIEVGVSQFYYIAQEADIIAVVN